MAPALGGVHARPRPAARWAGDRVGRLPAPLGLEARPQARTNPGSVEPISSQRHPGSCPLGVWGVRPRTAGLGLRRRVARRTARPQQASLGDDVVLDGGRAQTRLGCAGGRGRQLPGARSRAGSGKAQAGDAGGITGARARQPLVEDLAADAPGITTGAVPLHPAGGRGACAARVHAGAPLARRLVAPIGCARSHEGTPPRELDAIDRLRSPRGVSAPRGARSGLRWRRDMCESRRRSCFQAWLRDHVNSPKALGANSSSNGPMHALAGEIDHAHVSTCRGSPAVDTQRVVGIQQPSGP
jgi:hypothetical protein